MVAARCSRPAAPRAGPASPRDRSDPRPGGVRASPSSGPADQDDEPVVHLRDRPGRRTAQSGVRHRSRRRSGGGEEPSASADPGTAPCDAPAPGVVSRRGTTLGDRPGSSCTEQRDHRSGGPGACCEDGVMTSAPANECASPTGLPVRDPSGPARRLMAAIVWYQRGAEGRPSPCRFFPSCSSYAHESIAVHGALRGSWLAARRLVRCRPFGPSGVDMVPPPRHVARERHHAEACDARDPSSET